MTESPDTLFEFSVWEHLAHAWHLFTKHLQYFLAIGAVMTVFNFFFNTHGGAIARILGFLASLVWSYVSISSVLAAVDGKTDLLSFKAFQLHLPSWRLFGIFAGVTGVSAVIIGGGLIALVFPGIYFMTRLMFATFMVVDKKGGVLPSLRASWHLIRGHLFWTALLCLVVVLILLMLGTALVGVGIIFTYPIGMLLLALLYRALMALPQPVSTATPSAASDQVSE